MTTFEKIDGDARDEWMEHPVTRAFWESLRRYQAQITTGLLDQCKSGSCNYDQINVGGGELRAIDFILSMPRRPPRE